MENQYDSILKINYGSIQDKNQLQNLIVQHKSIIASLIKQIHELTNIKDKQELQREIIINKMQENMLQNTRQIINFKNLVNQITEQHQKLSKQFQQEKQKIKKNYQMQHSAEINELNKKLQQLETEYRSLHEIEQKQQNYVQEIKNLKQVLILRQYQHHDNMNKEEKKQIKENIQLSSHNQTKIVEVKKNIFSVAKTIVIEEKFNNQEKNHELKTKLLQLQGQLSILKKQRNDILGKRKQLKINISINEEELQEYKAVGSLQKAKIKANKDKIQQLKTVLSEEVRKKEQQISQAKKDKSNQVRSLKLKMAQLQKEKDEVKINLEKVKLLADTILMQRQQVQQFFIMSLQSCKKQIENNNQRAFNLGKQQEKRSYGDKVDVEELSPKDKQRILTNLYTKLALGP